MSVVRHERSQKKAVDDDNQDIVQFTRLVLQYCPYDAVLVSPINPPICAKLSMPGLINP